MISDCSCLFCHDHKMVNLKVGTAFAPLCQDEKAHPDTTPQKPRLVGEVKVLQRAVVKNCYVS